MEHRIRLSWSPGANHSWCPGTTEADAAPPPAPLPAPGLGRTSFLRLQQLLVRLRRPELLDGKLLEREGQRPPAHKL